MWINDEVPVFSVTVRQSSEAVTLDLLTLADLKLLHSSRAGSQATSSSATMATDASNKKRFLLLIRSIGPNRFVKSTLFSNLVIWFIHFYFFKIVVMFVLVWLGVARNLDCFETSVIYLQGDTIQLHSILEQV